MELLYAATVQDQSVACNGRLAVYVSCRCVPKP